MTMKHRTKRPIPRKLDEYMIRALSEAVARGNYPYHAAPLCGIDYTTYYNWMKQADEDIKDGVESYYTQLFYAIKRAEAEAADIMVQRVRDAALPGERKKVTRTDADGKTTEEITETGGEWLAAATFLERRYPDMFARRERHDVNVNETRTINITRVEVLQPQGQIVDAEYKMLEGEDAIQESGDSEESQRRPNEEDEGA